MLNVAFNKETCCRRQGNIIVACSMLHAMLPVECHKTFSTNSTKTKPVGNTMSQQTVAAAAYLVLCNVRKKTKRKHRWWKRELFMGSSTAQNDFLEKLLSDDQSLFKNFSRMSVENLNYLLHKLSPRIMKNDTELQVFYTLLWILWFFLVTNSSCCLSTRNPSRDWWEGVQH